MIFNNVVYTSDLENLPFIKECRQRGLNCFCTKDPRSAVYVATGIAAQNHETVIVFLRGSNTSRSAFTGMTEAYYRKLPVTLITIGKNLNYSKELNDVTYSHYVLEDINSLLEIPESNLPIHIEINTNIENRRMIDCHKLQEVLAKILGPGHYLYVGQGIVRNCTSFKCKVVYGGLENSIEGALANVLGASLANLRSKYVGLVSEEEYMQDINTLGNITMNDLVSYVVVGENFNNDVLAYAEALGFKTYSYFDGNFEFASLEAALLDNKKTVIYIHKED